MTIRHIGECQLCERNHKVRSGLLVHHGYERPGDGYIHGDCPGVDKRPYEITCDDIKPVLVRVTAHLAERRDYLARAKAGAIVSFDKMVRDYNKSSRDPNAYKLVTYKLGVTDPVVWRMELTSKIRDVEMQIRQIESNVERLTNRIASWQPRPLRVVDENGLTQEDRDARAQRAAERAEAKRTKDDARAALKAAKEARLAKRKAMLDDAGAKIRAAYIEKPRGEAQDVALAVLRELGKKKHNSLLNQIDAPEYWWEMGLHADEALVGLGLAKPVEGNINKYDYDRDLWRVW